MGLYGLERRNVSEHSEHADTLGLHCFTSHILEFGEEKVTRDFEGYELEST